MARSRIAVAGAEDKVEDALSSIGEVEVAIVVGDVVMLMKVAGGWKMLGAEFLNNSKTSPYMEVFYEYLARQDTVAHLFQLQLGFQRCRIWVSVTVVAS